MSIQSITNLSSRLPRPARLLWSVLLTAALGAVPAAAQQENTAVLSTADGDERVSTSDIRSIRFDGGVVTVVRPWGEQTFSGTLRGLTFLRPLPGTLRLTASATLDDGGALRRALSVDGGGALRSTWEAGDKVYVYADALSTEPIGTLTPQTTGSATSALVGDIDGTGLATGQTLHLSTAERPHSFATQTGTLDGLFYATASAAITVVGGNASLDAATFSNPQSVTAFTLRDGYGNAVAATRLTISGGAETITVTPATAASTLYVALPATGSETDYSFSVTTAGGETRTGTKTAQVTAGKYYAASVSVLLAAGVSAPTALTLSYNGEAQTLVSAGTPTGGTLSYRLGSDGAWSDALPAATAIGSYTVWYKVTGDADHHDVAAASVSASIGRGVGSVSYDPAAVGKTYGDAVFTHPLTLVGDGTATYGSSNEGVASVDKSTGAVTIFGAGSAVITATVSNGANYDYAETTASYTLTVSKGTPRVTAPTARTLTYTGSAQALVNAGNTTGGTLKYSLTEDGTYTATVPTGINAGSYTVYYKVEGGANYNDVSAASVSVSIGKAAATKTNPAAKSGLKYTGSAQALATAGSSSHGKFTYSATQGGTYTDNVPTGTAVGNSYAVYWKFTGDGNHLDDSGSLTGISIGKADGAGTLSATSVSFSNTTGSKTVTVSGNTGTVSASVTSGSGCSVSVSGSTITVTRSTNNAFNATVTVTIAASTNNNSTTRTFNVSGTAVYSAVRVESATMGSYKCAKVYTSATTGYYIMCTDRSTSARWRTTATWSTACSASVSAGGKTFKCGSKAEWEAIMSACGGTGYNSINTKCSGVSGWSAMSGTYWSSSVNSSDYPWYFADTIWYYDFHLGKSAYNYVRLVSAF